MIPAGVANPIFTKAGLGKEPFTRLGIWIAFGVGKVNLGNPSQMFPFEPISFSIQISNLAKLIGPWKSRFLGFFTYPELCLFLAFFFGALLFVVCSFL